MYRWHDEWETWNCLACGKDAMKTWTPEKEPRQTLLICPGCGQAHVHVKRAGQTTYKIAMRDERVHIADQYVALGGRKRN